MADLGVQPYIFIYVLKTLFSHLSILGRFSYLLRFIFYIMKFSSIKVFFTLKI